MKKLIFPGVFAAIALSACSGGASGEKLIGSWTCDGPDRPNMEFKAGGEFHKDTLGDPNSRLASGRASSESSGTYKLDGNSLPDAIRIAFLADPRG